MSRKVLPKVTRRRTSDAESEVQEIAGAVGLTDSKVRGLKAPESGQIEYLDKVVPGLRVRIGKTGTRTFVVRKRVGVKVKNITLGRFSDRFGVAAARRKARALLSDIEVRGAPALPKPRGNAAAGTVAALWEQYMGQVVRGRLASDGEIERIGRNHILPSMGDRFADTITRGDVSALVEAVTYRDPDKPTPRAGKSVHQQLSAFYAWALPKLDRLPGNPCRDAWRFADDDEWRDSEAIAKALGVKESDIADAIGGIPAKFWNKRGREYQILSAAADQGKQRESDRRKAALLEIGKLLRERLTKEQLRRLLDLLELVPGAASISRAIKEVKRP